MIESNKIGRKARPGQPGRTVFVATGCCITLLIALPLWWRGMNADPNVQIPNPALPSPNAFDFYVQAGKSQIPPKPPVDPVHDNRAILNMTPAELKRRYPLAAKEAWLRRNAPALQLVRQGMTHEFRQPAARSFAGPAFSNSFKHYAKFRELARLMVVESHAKSERGDWAGASRTTLDILHMGTDMPRGGPLIGALVGYAIQAIGRRSLWEAVPHLNTADSRAAAKRLEALMARRVGMAETLQEEKWTGQANLLEMMRAGHWRGLISPSMGDSDDTAPRPVWRDWLRVQFLSKRQAMDNYTRYMDDQIAKARRPYSAARLSSPLAPDPITAQLAGVFDRADWNAARNDSGNALVMASLALRAYKLERGSYPATLQALVPAYLQTVPPDPFSGGSALKYQLSGSTYRLWSVGPDGVNNGGQPIVDLKRTGRSRYMTSPDSKGDVVAGINT